MYSEIAMDHFRNPRNGGCLKAYNGRGIAGHPNSGPYMIVYLKVENNVVQEASFQTFGCPAAVAAGSALTEYLLGKETTRARLVTRDTILGLLGGLPLGKEHCADIASSALAAALDDYKTSEHSLE